ncbi:MAG TPA: HlyD family efflux transporter periplasmic adaptor subunit [Pyrinomonadaceae bacterium]|jgi:multidrug efflux pump subunit AcrA (membrane-fusion protein)|nr:HlyD family efflux transporter periplasmic adaptor subunit [Pyrinomonadaceae bacterium]
MNNKRKRWKLVATAAALFALTALVAVPVLRPKPLRVETARVVRGHLLVTVDAEGRTRVRDLFTVTAPVAGLLRRTTLRRGDLMRVGDTVALIEPARGVPAQIGQSQSYAPQSAVVRAPVTGRVLRVLEESERVVAAGTPLVEISNTSAVELVADVLSTDAVKIRPGARVEVVGWGGDAPLRARVRLVEPSAFTKVSALGVEEQRVNVVADFVGTAVPLGDGYRVEARFVMWEGEALKAPAGALFRKGESWSVFLVEGGRAVCREVKAGERNESEVEIKSGLDEGDEVIVHPSKEIKDGSRVETQGEAFDD